MALEQAVIDFLTEELGHARERAKTTMVELKSLLDRVQGATYWLKQDMHLMDWLQCVLEDAWCSVNQAAATALALGDRGRAGRRGDPDSLAVAADRDPEVVHGLPHG